MGLTGQSTSAELLLVPATFTQHSGDTGVRRPHLQSLQVRCRVETSCPAARGDHVLIGYDYCKRETARLGPTGERDAATANPW